MEYIFVADTNLFFECKSLENLTWDEIDVDPICIALTRPVLSEIDKHKRGVGRTRRRAIEIFNRVREMLNGETDELVIREASPRVVLRLSSAVKPDQGQAEVLDYTNNDDRIIGTALAMLNESPKVSVCLLTDDCGAAATARIVGLPYKLIPQNWKRPPEQTTEAKKIAELQKDLAVYRAQEPTIEIRNMSEIASADTKRLVAKALPTSTIDELIDRLEAKYPPHDDWSVPETEARLDGSKVTYEPASAEAVRRYLEEERPKWLTDCRAVLGSLHEGRIEWEDHLTLSFGISNVGNRPAANMRVTFEARGGVSIKRPSRDDDMIEVTKKREPVRPFPRLPTPPTPPQPTRTVIKPPEPPHKVDPSIVKIAKNEAILVAQGLSSFSGAKELGRFGNLSLSATDRLLGIDSSIGRLMLEQQKLFGLGSHSSEIERILGGKNSLGQLMRDQDQFRGVVSQFTDSIDPLFSGRDDLIRSITPSYATYKHDPEAFYPDNWDCHSISKRGAYVCDLFRHRGEEEQFDVEIVFPAEGNAKGVVICSVHAENLTEPVELKITVSRSIFEVDLKEQAEKLVAECSG